MRHEFLTIDLTPFVRRTKERMERLAAVRALVVSDPDVLGGVPVVRGTRVPVHDVAASIAAGLPTDRILAAYPSLDADKVELAAIYAEANPARGRPRTIDELSRGAVVAADRSPQEVWMKFLIDECLSPELTRLAQARGHGESSHVVWMGHAGRKDWELKSVILDGDWTFVTRNAVDFRGPANNRGSRGQYADITTMQDWSASMGRSAWISTCRPSCSSKRWRSCRPILIW